MRCRICGAEARAERLAVIRSPSGGTHEVHECRACGCRFADHEASVYETLHAASTSVYGWQDEIAEMCKRLFDSGDRNSLAAYLSMLSKNAFVIETIEAMSDCRRIMELGCSKGYLTAYFILAGYDIVGVDVAETAVKAAAARFGPHFAVPDSKFVVQRQPFDAIYHVGTIGCVEDPIGFTHSLLARLRPGGMLVFNAPNVDAYRERGTVWSASALPPDLVTLYSPRFWRQNFDAHCLVEVKEGRLPYKQRIREMASALRRGHIIQALRMPELDEFGLMVKMTKRA